MAWDAAVLTHFQQRKPFRKCWAFHCWPKNSSGVAVPQGLWEGDYDLTISLDGVSRTYIGVPGSLKISPPRARVGTNIQAQEVQIGLSPTGKQMVLGYETRNQKADLFCIVIDSATNAVIGSGREFMGFVSKAGVDYGALGEQDVLNLQLESYARNGEMTVLGKKSDASQRLRNDADRLFRYTDLGNIAADPWGVVND
jgi:hypothetical protein